MAITMQASEQFYLDMLKAMAPLSAANTILTLKNRAALLIALQPQLDLIDTAYSTLPEKHRANEKIVRSLIPETHHQRMAVVQGALLAWWFNRTGSSYNAMVVSNMLFGEEILVDANVRKYMEKHKETLTEAYFRVFKAEPLDGTRPNHVFNINGLSYHVRSVSFPMDSEVTFAPEKFKMPMPMLSNHAFWKRSVEAVAETHLGALGIPQFGPVLDAYVSLGPDSYAVAIPRLPVAHFVTLGHHGLLITRIQEILLDYARNKASSNDSDRVRKARMYYFLASVMFQICYAIDMAAYHANWVCKDLDLHHLICVRLDNDASPYHNISWIFKMPHGQGERTIKNSQHLNFMVRIAGLYNSRFLPTNAENRTNVATMIGHIVKRMHAFFVYFIQSIDNAEVKRQVEQDLETALKYMKLSSNVNLTAPSAGRWTTLPFFNKTFVLPASSLHVAIVIGDIPDPPRGRDDTQSSSGSSEDESSSSSSEDESSVQAQLIGMPFGQVKRDGGKAHIVPVGNVQTRDSARDAKITKVLASLLKDSITPDQLATKFIEGKNM